MREGVGRCAGAKGQTLASEGYSTSTCDSVGARICFLFLFSMRNLAPAVVFQTFLHPKEFNPQNLKAKLRMVSDFR